MIGNIQALRAVAANGVLLSHLRIIEQKYSHASPVLPAEANFGAFGADLFFVISGFIMATIARDASWMKFLASRAWRIFPPYWFYTTLVLLVSCFAPAAMNSSFAHPPSVWRSYLLVPDSVAPVLGVGWTLIHEMYFYLCFAFMIFLSGSRRLSLPFLLLIWTVAVFSLNAVFHLLEISNPIASVVAHPLTLEFILGAVAGILVQRKIAMFPASALTAGIIACAIALSFRDTTMALADGLNWTRAILVGTPCALIVYGAVAMEMRGGRVAPDWLAALGDASYSTYLSHVLVLSAIGRLFALMPSHSIALEAAFVVFCVVTANIAGLLSCRLIERRSANAARSRPKKVRHEETESLFAR